MVKSRVKFHTAAFQQKNYRQEANDITEGDIYNNNYFFLRTINYDAQYILAEKQLSWNFSFGINGMGQSSADSECIVFLVPEYNLFDIGFFLRLKSNRQVDHQRWYPF